MKRILVATVAAAALAAPALAQQPVQQDRDQSQMNGGHSQGQMSGAQKQAQTSSQAAGGAMISADQLTEAQIQDLQQALNQKGHDLEVDGKWGPRTQAALRDFNKAQNIQGSNDKQISGQTMSALGIDQSRFGGAGETTGQGKGSGSESGASDPGMSGGAPSR
jgi:peptidoglycan hydrolase-like protein with peptidoglycan-binding domain